MAGHEVADRGMAAATLDARADLPADVALDPTLVDVLGSRWTAVAPVHAPSLAHVEGP